MSVSPFLCWIPVAGAASPAWGDPAHMVEVPTFDRSLAASRWLERLHAQAGDTPYHGDEYAIRVRAIDGTEASIRVRVFVQAEYRGMPEQLNRCTRQEIREAA